MALCLLLTLMSHWLAGPGPGQLKDFFVHMENVKAVPSKEHGQEERIKKQQVHYDPEDYEEYAL